MPDEAISQIDVPATLNYVKRPRLAWIGRHSRTLTLLSLLFAIVIPIYRNWKPLKTRIEWLYWSRQCMAHQMPKDVALEVSDPKLLPQFASNPDYLIQTVQGETHAVYSPLAWQQLSQLDDRCIWMRRFLGATENPIIFLGTRQRPDGIPRLVIIKGAHTNAEDLMGFSQAVVLPLVKIFDPLPKSTRDYSSWFSGSITPAMLHSGEADPIDPTHIVFNVDIRPSYDKNRPTVGVVDVYLNNDDSLQCTLRPPASHYYFARHAIPGTEPDRGFTR